MNAVVNIHKRELPVAAATAETLLRTLATEDDPLWPWPRWPAMRFQDGLMLGAAGGHGPVRYTIEAIAPLRIQFRFGAPRGFDGIHAFEIEPIDNAHCRLTHELRMQAHGPARFTWPLVFHPLHDALIEDALDRAQTWARGAPWQPRKLSFHVRLLRFFARLFT